MDEYTCDAPIDISDYVDTSDYWWLSEQAVEVNCCSDFVMKSPISAYATDRLYDLVGRL